MPRLAAVTTLLSPRRQVLRRLRNARAFVLDMDGTLVLGDKSNHGLQPLPGALEFTHHLSANNVPYVLFTNGTARTPDQYAELLRQAGFSLQEGDVLTPAASAADLFSRRGYTRILVLGGEGLMAPLRNAGLDIVASQGEPVADAVLVGWFREFTFDALEAACHAAWKGAQVYSCSQSLYFATAHGRALGTSRAISAMIRDLTGAKIHVIGKPSLEALRCAARRIGVRTEELAVVGDDPSLELPMAHSGKSLAIAVQTGIATSANFADLPARQRPHLIVHGVDELLALYKGYS